MKIAINQPVSMQGLQTLLQRIEFLLIKENCPEMFLSGAVNGCNSKKCSTTVLTIQVVYTTCTQNTETHTYSIKREQNMQWKENSFSLIKISEIQKVSKNIKIKFLLKKMHNNNKNIWQKSCFFQISLNCHIDLDTWKALLSPYWISSVWL